MIPETDLIIKNGNIYHLDANKNNIAKTILLVGDPNRVQMVSKYFDKITHVSQHREIIIHTGYIGDKYLTCLSTGMGVGCIDIVINELDAIFNIDLKTREIKKDLTSLNLIRLGTCGSLQEDIPIDSVIVSKYGLGLDNLMSFYDGGKKFYNKKFTIKRQKTEGLLDTLLSIKNGKYIPTEDINYTLSTANPYIVECNNSLLKLFPEYRSGITCTSTGFYGPQGRNLRIKNNTNRLISILNLLEYDNNKILNFEMETSALYGLGLLGGHKCLTLNTVVANRITKEFSKNSDLAIDNMIKMFLEKIITI